MKHNFTFTELMLVIGLSSLTFALAAGAAAGMKDDPKTVACAQVMHSIEQKTTAFENDHGGTLISGNNKGKLWGAQLVAGGYFSKSGYYDRNRTQPKEFECPAETRDRGSAHPVTGMAGSYDYALNWGTHYKIAKDGEQNLLRSKLKNPAMLIRMLEGTKFAIFQNPTDVTDRHGDTAGNVVFEDGHIAFMETIPYKDCENYKAEYWRN